MSHTISPRISDFDLQCWLAARGFYGHALDGDFGPRSRTALQLALSTYGTMTLDKVLHRSGLWRIVMHWTAGEEGVNALEAKAYHSVTGVSGITKWGTLKPEANASTADGVYAAHTLGLNTGSIGLALDAMAGAKERPFSWGSEPITPGMLAAFVAHVADVASVYDIPIHPVSCLTHAEVQGTLGVRQKNKWDITVLPNDRAPRPPREVGDELRRMIRAAA